jgi:hypothetical protein
VTRQLKTRARTARLQQPKKAATAGQQLYKHVPVAMNMSEKMEELLQNRHNSEIMEKVFSM